LAPDPTGTIDDELIRERARQLFGEKRGSKVSAFLRHPLTALVLGFLLTGVLGKIFQVELEKAQRDGEVRDARRSIALQVADSVGLRLNRLYYDAGRYYDALREHTGDSTNLVVQARRQRFDSTRALFEATEYVEAALVCNNFGDSLQREFRTVADSMHWIPVRLRDLGSRSLPVETAARHIDNLRSLVANFALSMVHEASEAANRKPPQCSGVAVGPGVSRARP
jgi:hypothetical protein